MSDPSSDFGDFMEQMGKVKVVTRVWDDPPKPTPLAEVVEMMGKNRKDGESLNDWLDRLESERRLSE